MANPTGIGGRKFQKGQSGNPGGRPKMPDHLKGHYLTNQEMRATLAKYIKMKKDEIYDAALNPDTPVFELWIASGITKGIALGDWTNLRDILDRLCGKPQPEKDSDDDSGFSFTLNYKE